MKKYTYIFISVLLAIVLAFAVYNYGNINSNAESNLHEDTEAVLIQKDSPEFKKVLTKTSEDYFLGSENAPITMIEYASLSCPHCAHFHENVIEPLIESHINTGKVKFIFRDFPLNPPALEASMLARCFGQMRYFSLLKAFFLSQESWVNENYKTKLKAIVKPIGIDDTKYQECTTDKKTEEQILQTRQEAETKLGVSSTPTIFINGVEYTGKRDYGSVTQYIDSQLKAN